MCIVTPSHGWYPLVICYIANWKITMLLIGKPSISMGHGFHGYVSLPEGTLEGL